jgi:hypothetical protein
LFVRKHILEEDNIDVEGLKGSIERYRYLEQEVLKRERQLDEIAEARRRLQTWAQHRLRYNSLKYEMAHAERRRHEILLERLGERRAEIGRLIEREEHARRNHEQAIRSLEEDMLRQRSLLAELPQALQIAGLDAQLQSANEAKRAARTSSQRRVVQLGRLSVLAERTERVPFQFHPALKAVEELVELARGKGIEELGRHDADLVALERRILPLAATAQSLQQQLGAVSADAEQQKKRLDELEKSLSSGGGGAILSPWVRDFIALLGEHGIEATPLPDLVDVSDTSWAMALEMLLGPNREALLVPRHRLTDAFSLLYRERHRLDRCRLVDLRKTERWQQRLAEGSIAEILVTHSEDARVYIERQVGRMLKAETDFDLDKLDHAVTRRGKTTQGMSLRVYKDIVPLFGKTAQAAALEKAREEFRSLSETYRRTLADREALQGALAALAALADEPADLLEEALGNLREAEATARAVERSRKMVESPEAGAIRDEIAGIRADIEGYRNEIDTEIVPKLKRLQQQDVDLQLEERASTLKKAEMLVEEERRIAVEADQPLASIVEFLESDDTVETARNRVAVAAELRPAGADPAAYLHDLVAETASSRGRAVAAIAEESAAARERPLEPVITQHVVRRALVRSPTILRY